MADKDVKIKLRNEERANLEQIAAHYECFRGENPHLQKLIRLIASGDLEVKKPSTAEISSRKLPSNLIQLRIQVKANVNGILLKISDIIAKHNGDIYLAKASEDSHIIFISLNLSSSKNLVKLADDIKKVNFSDLIQFNSRKQKEKILSDFFPENFKLYDQFKETMITGKESKTNKEILLDERLKYYLGKSNFHLIFDVSYTITLRLEIKHHRGTLFEILKKIADNQLSISSVEIDSIYKQESGKKNSVYLRLNIDTETIQNEVSTVNKIKELIDSLVPDILIKPVELVPTKLD